MFFLGSPLQKATPAALSAPCTDIHPTQGIPVAVSVAWVPVGGAYHTAPLLQVQPGTVSAPGAVRSLPERETTWESMPTSSSSLSGLLMKSEAGRPRRLGEESEPCRGDHNFLMVQIEVSLLPSESEVSACPVPTWRFMAMPLSWSRDCSLRTFFTVTPKSEGERTPSFVPREVVLDEIVL